MFKKQENISESLDMYKQKTGEHPNIALLVTLQDCRQLNSLVQLYHYKENNKKVFLILSLDDTEKETSIPYWDTSGGILDYLNGRYNLIKSIDVDDYGSHKQDIELFYKLHSEPSES